MRYGIDRDRGAYVQTYVYMVQSKIHILLFIFVAEIIVVVAFVGQLSPVGTIFATLFTSWITHGAQMMLQTSYPFEIADIITSIIVYLSGLTGLVIVLVNKHVFKNKAKKEELALQAANADTPVSSQEITENIIPDNANEKGGKE